MFEELKIKVYKANLELVTRGLVTLTWGNVSGLAADRSMFVIKPSGVPYCDMRPGHMVVVSIDTGLVVEGSMKPSSDAPTHRMLYRHFSGVGGVAHTHSPRVTAFAQARRELPCYGTTHADHFFGAVPVTRALTEREVEQAYELNTGQVIVERFANLDPAAMPAVLLPGHAPFTWGRDADDAVANAVALEAVAGMALDTLLLDPTAHPLEQHVLNKHYHRKHGSDAYYGQP